MHRPSPHPNRPRSHDGSRTGRSAGRLLRALGVVLASALTATTAWAQTPDLSITTFGFVDVFEGGQSEAILVSVDGAPLPADTVDVVVTWDPTDLRVDGDSSGSRTLSYTGQAVIDGLVQSVPLTLSAFDDLLDESAPESVALQVDVVSSDPGLDALGPFAVSGIRVWDDDGDTGGGQSRPFLLHQEGFETDGNGSRYVLSRPEFNNQNSTFGGDWFTRTVGGVTLQNATPGAETYGISGGSEGSWFFSVQDPNGPISGSNVETLEISGIDIADHTNLWLDLDLAEDDQDDGNEDWNASTFFLVEARIDGGAYQPVLRIEGTDQTDHEPGHDTDFDSERDGEPLSEAWKEFGGAIAGAGTILDLRLTFNDMLFSGEDIAIDDIRVTGDQVPDLNVLTSGFADVFEGGQSDTMTVQIMGTPQPTDTVDLLVTWDATDLKVDGDSSGSRTLSFTGQAVLDGLTQSIPMTLSAFDDLLDETAPESAALQVDVVSSDPGLDALGPIPVTAIRVWDDEGDTGGGQSRPFLLHQEGFETDGNGSRYALSRAEFNNQNSTFGGDWFTRTIGGVTLQNATPGAETYGISGGSEGSWFFSVQDPNGPISGSNVETLEISGIFIADHTNLWLDLDLAEDDQDDGNQDWNASTFFLVEARIDGGAYQPVLRIEGTDQTDHEPGHDTDFDSERDGEPLSEAWKEFGGAIAGTGTTLDLRFTFNDMLFSGEDIAIDDIRVTGDQVPDLNVLTSGFADVFEGGQSDTMTVQVEGTPLPTDTVDVVVTWDATDLQVDGDSSGSRTLSFTGQAVLDGLTQSIPMTLSAFDDLLDESAPESAALQVDVVSSDPGLDALGPVAVTAIRVWDDEGDTGGGQSRPVLIYQEGFETDGNGSRYVLSRAEFNNQNSTFGGDWFTRTVGGSALQNPGAGAETYGIFGGSEGSWFFSVQDPNGPISGSNVETLEIPGVTVSGFADLWLDLDLAEDDQDDGNEDWNASTFFLVEARIDGGAYQPVLRIEGTDQTDHEPGHDTDFDSERDGEPLSEAWKEFGGAIAGAGTILDLRLTFNDMLFSGEDIAIDDIRVTGATDSDGDGLSDAEEASLGTNPFDADSDDDGLEDGEELDVYGTNPLDPDSDDDGRADGDEVVGGTNPLDGSDPGGIPIYVIGGPNAVVAPSSGTYAFDGARWVDYRAALEDVGNFGPGGVRSPRPVATFALPEVTPASLAGLDAFVSPWWYDVDADPAESQAVVDFFLAGGDLILLQDTASQDEVGSLLGLPAVASDGSVSNGGAPLFDGPFGTAANVEQAGLVGALDPVDIAAANGTVVATNASGQVTAAFWAPGDYAPGAGAMLILGDVNMWTTEATYFLPNDNGVFALNGTSLLIPEPYVLSGPSAALTPASSSWSWDSGVAMSDYRAALSEGAFFGPGGVSEILIDTRDLASVDAAALAEVDGFVSSWWADGETTPAQVTAVVDFFLAGGDLILLQDDANHDAIGDALGLPSFPSTGSPSNGGFPIAQGLFGTASNIAQSGSRGRVDLTDFIAAGGRVGATNAESEITVAYWEAGDYAPGAGRLVIVGDVDMFANTTATYDPLNDNGIFALNATAFAVPEPAFGLTLGAGASLLALVAARRRRALRGGASRERAPRI